MDALVVGYGNDLCRDDAAGLRVAEAVAARGLPGVEVVAVHELMPELAESLAKVRLAVFVDAGAAAEVHRLDAEAGPASLSHVADPRALLALAAALYGRRPEAWLVTVAARDLGIGEKLSPAAVRGVGEAVATVTRLVGAAHFA